MAQGSFDGQEVMNFQHDIGGDDLNKRTQHLQEIRKKFGFFLRDWSKDNTYIYREQLLSNSNIRAPIVEIDLEDLLASDQKLYIEAMQRPDDALYQFEKACTATHNMLAPQDKAPNFQVCFVSNQCKIALRDIKSDLIGKTIVLPAIVVATSKPVVKATHVKAQCKNCNNVISLDVQLGLGGVNLPRVCQAPRPQDGMGAPKCPIDPFVILPDRCTFIDQQTIKIQDRPEDIPTGDMPRTLMATLDRYLVDKVSPGSRVTILAILSVFGNRNQATLRNSFLRVVGIMIDDSEKSRYRNFYTADDEETFHVMAREKEIYSKLAKSIAPAVFGSEDIKKAITCLLFGGSRKVLPEGMNLRGDINVLLIGDPSTAKSQLLKFVGRTAPIAVTTSGKGSSASGLTASVIRDPSTKEFQLQGGAMVLADGGVVCIDEFDKMRPEDRVAIHEAMEQQTISIAKAGITTILNSRVSVLAAANPIHGSYDDYKEAQEQIDLQTTILSRFDCIFLVRDVRDMEHDRKLASHVINLHMGNMIPVDEAADIDIGLLKKYIAYAKAKCVPRLSSQTAQILANHYVSDRKKLANEAFPITVRQLEAIIRLSEAIAKTRLSTEVTPEDIEEAHRLFEVSTLSAASAGLSSSGVAIPKEMADLVLRIEDAVKRKVAVGSKITKQRLDEQLQSLFPDKRAIDMAINNMIKRQELQQLSGWRKVVRIR